MEEEDQNFINNQFLRAYELEKPLGVDQPLSLESGYMGQPSSDFLSPSMGFSSEDSGVTSSRPLSSTSAQNTAQRGEAGSNALMDAWKSIQGMYEPTGGIPFAGSEDIRVKRDVYGRPYTTVRVSPMEHRGLGGELIKDKPEDGFKLRSGIEGARGTKWEGPHSWEKGARGYGYTGNESWDKTKINPYIGSSIFGRPSEEAMQSKIQQSPKTSEYFNQFLKRDKMIA